MKPKPPRPESVPPHPMEFSVELRLLVKQCGPRVTLGGLLAATRGRGYYLLLLIVALPFVGPIPLPGFSIPFGLVVALIALPLSLDRTPWLPQRLLQREIPALGLTRWLGAASRIMRWIERVVRPRLRFVSRHAIFRQLAGLQLAVSGFMLTLPLPLPFSNSLPAWNIILLAAGALAGDGLFFFAGSTVFLVSLGYFGMLAWGGSELYARLAHAIGL